MLCVDEWCNSSDVTTVGNKNKLKQLNPYSMIDIHVRPLILGEEKKKKIEDR